MFAVIFVVQPHADRWDQYLGLAAQLRPELERIEGFIDNERFRSRRTEGRLLSLSIWADEKAVVRWRTHALHHFVQEKGRSEVFENYHLRVGEITSDSALPAGEAPVQQRFDATAVGAAKLVSISESMEPALLHYAPLAGDAEMFESITAPGKHLLLRSWHDGAAAEAWQPPEPARHRRVRVIRDYGLADRREAPQYYPDVTRPAPQA
ncbi:MAG: antibiotic biosynthesis monooxygenase [Acetobacteraceae bacterium]